MLWLSKSSRVRKYKRVRKIGRSLNSKILKTIPKEVIERTARDMGLLSKGILVLDSEDEADFLFDRAIYDVPWGGKSAVEHLETESGIKLSEMEQKILEAMKQAYFSLFEVIGVVRGESIQLSDLLSDNQIELMDISLSSTTSTGVLLAARIFRIEDIYMTTGVVYPFQSEQKDALMSVLKTRQTVRRGQRKRAVRRMDFSNPRNYSSYFFRQYKKLGALEIRMSR